ncbi:uncharacterized protein [Trachinotus anak]|uniref:uncharacterized protein isoform X3 n=1 Tax=Trachinotus anak TaxID=443729 RepID=UPI0039F24F31
MADGGTTDRAAQTLPEKRRRPWWSAEAKEAKRESDRNRGETRVRPGRAFTRWRELRKSRGFKSDIQLASFLLDHYLRTRSGSRPEPPRPDRCSSAETCESMNSEYPFLSSPYEEKWAAPFVQSSENGKEPGTKDAALQRSESHDEWSTTRQSQNNESDDQEDDEEFSTSLSVGDGRYLVDLGSSSEFIVDEECILQLFKSCRECNKQCSVRKRVQGLKLVVYQACCFCESRYTWTNLPDEDEDDGSGKDDGELQINGKDTAHGQTDTAVSPRRNTS